MIDTKPANSEPVLTNPQTLPQYTAALQQCRDLFLKKTSDYGTSWRVLRPISITDQIFIKAWRIRQIQEKKVQLIADSIESEFVGIVNYGIMALVQAAAIKDEDLEWSTEKAAGAYDAQVEAVRELMLLKNSDYGEAWRQMSEQSFVDLILTKLLRIRQIIANEGNVSVSEGADANFADIVNYALFALILRSEKAGQ